MITSFDSLDEMLAAIAKARAEATALFEALPKEVVRALSPGKFATLHTEEYDFPVFFELFESQDEEDREYFSEHPEMILARGYSIACPTGEFGTLYKSSLLPISDDLFAEAISHGWDLCPAYVLNRATTYAHNLIRQLD